MIGPSNPVISIGPILSMPAAARGDRGRGAPVVAVSPYVAGQVVKGPTDLFMRAVGRPSTAAGVASLYEGLIDGMVCDPEDPDPPPESVRGDELPDPDGGAGGPARPGGANPRVRVDPSSRPTINSRNSGINRASPGSLTLRGVGNRQFAHDRDRSGEGALGRQRAARRPARPGGAQPPGRGPLPRPDREAAAQPLHRRHPDRHRRLLGRPPGRLVRAQGARAGDRRGPLGGGRGRRPAPRWPRAPSGSRCCPSTARCSTPTSSTPISAAPRARS